MILAQLALGAVVAALSVVAVRKVLPRRERWLWSVSLVGAALVYVVAAAIRADRSSELLVEVVGATTFGLVAVAGWRVSAAVLAVGWAAHALWDLLLPRFIETDFIPTWYVVACMGFDLVVAGYFVRVAVARRVDRA